MFSDKQKVELSAPLNRSSVKERTQANRQFSYIEGWHAIAECNRIFGFGEWDRETIDLRQLADPREVDGKWRVAYMARVRVTVRPNGGSERVVREGCGYGSGIDRDIGSAHESAIKEAETDAMKRALMTFGNQFGLALYDKAQAGVDDAPSPTAARTAPASRAASNGATDVPKPPAGKSTPREWADTAIETIRATASQDDLSEWEARNDKAVLALRGKDAKAHADVVAAIRDQSARVG